MITEYSLITEDGEEFFGENYGEESLTINGERGIPFQSVYNPNGIELLKMIKISLGSGCSVHGTDIVLNVEQSEALKKMEREALMISYGELSIARRTFPNSVHQIERKIIGLGGKLGPVKRFEVREYEEGTLEQIHLFEGGRK